MTPLQVARPDPVHFEGLVQPLGDPIGYFWSVSEGSLSGADTATPTFDASSISLPSTMSQVTLTLCPKSDCSVCSTNRTLEVYRDHVERDYENFGAGISCGDLVDTTWPFTRYGIQITMPHTWNCHGSVWHAYNGAGNGAMSAPPGAGDGFTVTEYTDPINWSSALSGLNRGDVVSFYHNDQLEHSHTCLGSTSQMYGANNQPGMNIVMIGSNVYITGTWKWYVCSSQQYYDQFNSDYHGFYPDAPFPYMNKIKVHRK